MTCAFCDRLRHPGLVAKSDHPVPFSDAYPLCIEHWARSRAVASQAVVARTARGARQSQAVQNCCEIRASGSSRRIAAAFSTTARGHRRRLKLLFHGVPHAQERTLPRRAYASHWRDVPRGGTNCTSVDMPAGRRRPSNSTGRTPPPTMGSRCRRWCGVRRRSSRPVAGSGRRRRMTLWPPRIGRAGALQSSSSAWCATSSGS